MQLETKSPETPGLAAANGLLQMANPSRSNRVIFQTRHLGGFFYGQKKPPDAGGFLYQLAFSLGLALGLALALGRAFALAGAFALVGM